MSAEGGDFRIPWPDHFVVDSIEDFPRLRSTTLELVRMTVSHNTFLFRVIGLPDGDGYLHFGWVNHIAAPLVMRNIRIRMGTVAENEDLLRTAAGRDSRYNSLLVRIRPSRRIAWAPENAHLAIEHDAGIAFIWAGWLEIQWPGVASRDIIRLLNEPRVGLT